VLFSSSPALAALRSYATTLDTTSLRVLFANDPERFRRFSLEAAGLLFDYSKCRVDAETMRLLCTLAEERGLRERIDAMFRGERINTTEQRSVLHTALRNRSSEPVLVDGSDVMPAVGRVLEAMREFSERVRSGEHAGVTGERITDVVNIGIGGSDLGPAMVCQALQPYTRSDLRVHFVSNVDGADIATTLAPLDPARTLFIIASKTFTTQETMANARAARRWLVRSAGEGAVAQQMVALSTNHAAVAAFGIEQERTFEFWDWVGGRYSLWSAIGLSIAVAVGFDRFEELLDGAHELDAHFRSAPFERNVPVLLGLLRILSVNVHGAQAVAVLPYSQQLRRLPAWLQQLDMESNGKRVTLAGESVDWQTGPVIFGEPGTNGQHSFHQLLHQGATPIPCDFIVPMRSAYAVDDQHAMLVANALAQAEALMRGRTAEEARAAMEQEGRASEEIERLVPHRVFPGNRPSITIAMEQVTPRSLGALLALYEHATFVQGAIWGINSFDQWGVELGKQLAGAILPELTGDTRTHHDSSTAGLIERYHRGG